MQYCVMTCASAQWQDAVLNNVMTDDSPAYSTAKTKPILCASAHKGSANRVQRQTGTCSIFGYAEVQPIFAIAKIVQGECKAKIV